MRVATRFIRFSMSEPSSARDDATTRTRLDCSWLRASQSAESAHLVASNHDRCSLSHAADDTFIERVSHQGRRRGGSNSESMRPRTE